MMRSVVVIVNQSIIGLLLLLLLCCCNSNNSRYYSGIQFGSAFTIVQNHQNQQQQQQQPKRTGIRTTTTTTSVAAVNNEYINYFNSISLSSSSSLNPPKPHYIIRSVDDFNVFDTTKQQLHQQQQHEQDERSEEEDDYYESLFSTSSSDGAADPTIPTSTRTGDTPTIMGITNNYLLSLGGSSSISFSSSNARSIPDLSFLYDNDSTAFLTTNNIEQQQQQQQKHHVVDVPTEESVPTTTSRTIGGSTIGIDVPQQQHYLDSTSSSSKLPQNEDEIAGWLETRAFDPTEIIQSNTELNPATLDDQHSTNDDVMMMMIDTIDSTAVLSSVLLDDSTVSVDWSNSNNNYDENTYVVDEYIRAMEERSQQLLATIEQLEQQILIQLDTTSTLLSFDETSSGVTTRTDDDAAVEDPVLQQSTVVDEKTVLILQESTISIDSNNNENASTETSSSLLSDIVEVVPTTVHDEEVVATTTGTSIDDGVPDDSLDTTTRIEAALKAASDLLAQIDSRTAEPLLLLYGDDLIKPLEVIESTSTTTPTAEKEIIIESDNNTVLTTGTNIDTTSSSEPIEVAVVSDTESLLLLEATGQDDVALSQSDMLVMTPTTDQSVAASTNNNGILDDEEMAFDNNEDSFVQETVVPVLEPVDAVLVGDVSSTSSSSLLSSSSLAIVHIAKQPTNDNDEQVQEEILYTTPIVGLNNVNNGGIDLDWFNRPQTTFLLPLTRTSTITSNQAPKSFVSVDVVSTIAIDTKEDDQSTTPTIIDAFIDHSCFDATASIEQQHLENNRDDDDVDMTSPIDIATCRQAIEDSKQLIAKLESLLELKLQKQRELELRKQAIQNVTIQESSHIEKCNNNEVPEMTVAAAAAPIGINSSSSTMELTTKSDFLDDLTTDQLETISNSIMKEIIMGNDKKNSPSPVASDDDVKDDDDVLVYIDDDDDEIILDGILASMGESDDTNISDFSTNKSGNIWQEFFDNLVLSSDVDASAAKLSSTIPAGRTNGNSNTEETLMLP